MSQPVALIRNIAFQVYFFIDFKHLSLVSGKQNPKKLVLSYYETITAVAQKT